jgi:hypothetical protein
MSRQKTVNDLSGTRSKHDETTELAGKFSSCQKKFERVNFRFEQFGQELIFENYLRFVFWLETLKKIIF